MKTDDMMDELANRFTYHAPEGDQEARYAMIRDSGHSFAIEIFRLTPPSRERDIALGKLEEAVMWANAAIARRELSGD